MASSNLYEPHPFMIDSGTFWRCRHGHTGFGSTKPDVLGLRRMVTKECWRCGIFHPWKCLKSAVRGWWREYA